MNRNQRYEKASKLILVSVFFAFITIIFTNIYFGRTLSQQLGNIIALLFTVLISIIFYVKKYNWLRITLLILFFISIPSSILYIIKAYNISSTLFQLLLLQIIFEFLGIKKILRK